MAKDNKADGINKTKLGGSSPSKPKRGDGLADLMVRSLNRDAENTKKFHGKRLRSGSDYEKADVITGKSLGSLAAENMMAGKGLGSSLKQAFGDKFKSIGTRAKGKVDPLNILSKISPLAATYYGKKRNRSMEDISYFTGIEPPERQSTTSSKVQNIPTVEAGGSSSNLSANINGTKTQLGALKKIYNLLYTVRKEDQNWRNELRKQAEIDRSFQEEKDYENQKQLRAMKALGLGSGNSYFGKQKTDASKLNLPWAEILEAAAAAAGVGGAGLAAKKILDKNAKQKAKRDKTPNILNAPNSLNRSQVKKLAKEGIKQNSKGRFINKSGKFVPNTKVDDVLGRSATKVIKPGRIGLGGAGGMAAFYLADRYSIPHLYKMYGQGKPIEQIEAEEDAMSSKEKWADLMNTYQEMFGFKTASKFNEDPISIEDREKMALAYFQSKEGGGWTKEQASGIVANLKAESGLDPTIYNKDGSGAYGIAQWLGSRVQDFKETMGKELKGSSFLDQLKFVNMELHNKESAAGSMLRRTTTPQEASDVMMEQYERPSKVEQSQSVNKRRRFADKLSTVDSINNPSSRMNNLVGENQALKTDANASKPSAPVVINNTNNVGTKQTAGVQHVSSAEPRNNDPVYVRLQYQNVRTV